MSAFRTAENWELDKRMMCVCLSVSWLAMMQGVPLGCVLLTPPQLGPRATFHGGGSAKGIGGAVAVAASDGSVLAFAFAVHGLPLIGQTGPGHVLRLAHVSETAPALTRAICDTTNIGTTAH